MSVIKVGCDIHMRAHRGDERFLHESHCIQVGPSHVGSESGIHTLFRHQSIERDCSIEHLIVAGQHYMSYSVLNASCESGVLEIDMSV